MSPLIPPSPSAKDKIARLPHVIREQLNRRLADGESALSLLTWLNSHPAVLDVLAAEFDGHEINEPNLSDWHQGGFQDWLHSREQDAAMEKFIEQSKALAIASRGADLFQHTSKLALLALSNLLGTLTRGAAAQDPANRACLLAVIREIAQFRRMDIEAQRLRLKREQWEAKSNKEPKPQNSKPGTRNPEHDVDRELLDLMEDNKLMESLLRSLPPQAAANLRDTQEALKRSFNSRNQATPSQSQTPNPNQSKSR